MIRTMGGPLDRKGSIIENYIELFKEVMKINRSMILKESQLNNLEYECIKNNFIRLIKKKRVFTY